MLKDDKLLFFFVNVETQDQDSCRRRVHPVLDLAFFHPLDITMIRDEFVHC